MAERIKVRLEASSKNGGALEAWATACEDGDGYSLEWDDGFKDVANTRWHFEGDGWFNLEEVK